MKSHRWACVAVALVALIGFAFALDPMPATALPVTGAVEVLSVPFEHSGWIDGRSHSPGEGYGPEVRYNAYKVYLNKGVYYQFTQAQTFRAFEMVLDLNGEVIRGIQSWGPDESMTCFTPPASGYYYVAAGSAGYFGQDVRYRFGIKVVEVGQVSGQLTDQQGNPLTGTVRFNLTSERISSVLDLRPDETGFFVSDHLPIGQYSLEFFVTDHIYSYLESVQVKAGQTTPVVMKMSKGSKIRGIVRGNNGQPIPERVIIRAFRLGSGETYLDRNWVEGDASQMGNGPTLPDGSFSIGGLPHGKYIVSYAIESWDQKTGALVQVVDYSYFSSSSTGLRTPSVIEVGEETNIVGIDGRLPNTSGKLLSPKLSIDWVGQSDQVTGSVALGGLLSGLPGRAIQLERSLDGGSTWQFVADIQMKPDWESWYYHYRPEPSDRVPHLVRARFSGELDTAPEVVSASERVTFTGLQVGALFMSTPTPMRWDGTTLLSGYMHDSGGLGIAGTPIRLERSINGGLSWARLASVRTGTDGNWEYTYDPSSSYQRSQLVRANFYGDETYDPHTGTECTLKVTATLWRPKLSTNSPTRNRTFTVSGYIAPRFGPGVKPARAYFYRKQSDGSWKYVKYVTLVTSYYSTSKTKLSAKTSLPNSGSYRVRVRYDGAKTYGGYILDRTYSSYHTFTVKR